MASNPLQMLKNKHNGSDIYVIGSGPSLTYIDPSFFDNKVVVCINHTIRFVNAKEGMRYLVAKEANEVMQRMANSKQAKIVMCKYHSGIPPKEGEDQKERLNRIFYPDDTYMFDARTDVIGHLDNTTALERSSSTIVSGIHLAAFMGAKNIILVGHDCGDLDGQRHVKNYNKKNAVIGENAYKKWMVHRKVEKKTLKAKKILNEKWGINVYSLNPFINFNLEGHKYDWFGEKE